MKIKGVLVMPGMEVKRVKIPASIKFIKSFIGKDLGKIAITENTAIFIDKNPNIEESNRIYRGNIIMGKFLIVGIKNNKLVSLKKREIKRYLNLFKLSKHSKKIEYFKQDFLEKYYARQVKLKRKANKENKEKIFGIAA